MTDNRVNAHGRSPWREAFEIAMARRHVSPNAVELGQAAATGKWYVKSLTTTQLEHEGWGPFLERAAKMAAELERQLPGNGDTLTRDLQKSVAAIKPAAAAKGKP